MKKITALILCICMVLTLAACSSTAKDPDTTKAPTDGAVDYSSMTIVELITVSGQRSGSAYTSRQNYTRYSRTQAGYYIYPYRDGPVLYAAGSGSKRIAAYSICVASKAGLAQKKAAYKHNHEEYDNGHRYS